MGIGGARREHLEPALRVLDAWNHQVLNQVVEATACEVTNGGLAYPPRAMPFAAANRNIELRQPRRQESRDLRDWHRQVRVADEPIVAPRPEHSRPDRPALAAMRFALQRDTWVPDRILLDDGAGPIGGTIVHDSDFPGPGRRAEILLNFGERRTEP